MEVWDSHSDARIRFNANDFYQKQLGYITENELISHCMVARLKQNYNVQLNFSTTVTAVEFEQSSATITLGRDAEMIRSDLIIAADGSESALRKMAGIEQDQEDFQQDALVATFQCEHHHRHTALQCFTPEGPIAMLPLDGQRCSLVWSCDRGKSSALISLPDNVFCSELELIFGDQLGKLTLLQAPQSFALKSRHARQYIGPRLALVGDAAHTVHPLAGLGANLGFIDAAALIETVVNARSEGKSIGNRSVLRRYERWRRGDNGVAINAMRAFKNMFGSSDAFAAHIRQTGFGVVDTALTLKRPFAEYAMGLIGDLPAACRENAQQISESIR
jgi:2-octaprenylphenol hydroxylase